MHVFYGVLAGFAAGTVTTWIFYAREITAAREIIAYLESEYLTLRQAAATVASNTAGKL